MLIGIFADTHDHLDHIRRAVNLFNRRQCDRVIFAGDLVSTFAIPPLRRLSCRLIFSFGDNEGNKMGIHGGMEVIGQVAEPPFCHRLDDGTRLLITHQKELVSGCQGDEDVVIFAHTHKPFIGRDTRGVLHINPGETSGWTYGRPTVAIWDSGAPTAEIVDLSDDGAMSGSPPRTSAGRHR